MAYLKKEIKSHIPITTRELLVALLSEYYRNFFYVRKLEELGLDADILRLKFTGLLFALLNCEGSEKDFEILEMGEARAIELDVSELELEMKFGEIATDIYNKFLEK